MQHATADLPLPRHSLHPQNSVHSPSVLSTLTRATCDTIQDCKQMFAILLLHPCYIHCLPFRHSTSFTQLSHLPVPFVPSPLLPPTACPASSLNLERNHLCLRSKRSVPFFFPDSKRSSFASSNSANRTYRQPHPLRVQSATPCVHRILDRT